MRTKERNVGLDLLRILAMLFVVVVHVLAQGGVMEAAMSVSKAHYYSLKFLQVFAYCAVPCYAMLSGYVGVGRKWKPSNLISLIFTALFYTVGFSVLFYFLKRSEIGFGEMVKGMIPDYWYLVAYCGMFFFMPILNKALETLSQKQMFSVLLLCFLAFSGTSPIFMVMGRDPFYLGEGFTMIWLMFLYLVGGYLQLYGICRGRIKTKMAILLGISVVATFLSKVVTNTLGYGNMNLLYHYTSPTILLASLALVVLFANINIQWKKKHLITYMATFTFAVYLIHQQQFVSEYCVVNQFLWILNLNCVVSVLAVLGSALAIYIVCTLMDVARFYIFKWLHLKELAVWIEKIGAKVGNWLIGKMKIE